MAGRIELRADERARTPLLGNVLVTSFYARGSKAGSAPAGCVRDRDWPWVMLQRWHDLCFAHWPLAPAALRPLLPPGLELDLFEDRAWVGVVPFRMSGVRMRWLPPLPTAGAFCELNVRTYVRHRGAPGVYFFSLDAASALAVAAARRWFRLPYFRAAMSLEERDGEIAYRSRRTQRGAPAAELEMTYAPSGEPRTTRPGTLEHFLTARFALFNQGKYGELLTTEIEHPPWPLQEARGSIAHNTMALASGIELPATPPLLHVARFLEVRIRRPRPVADPLARRGSPRASR